MDTATEPEATIIARLHTLLATDGDAGQLQSLLEVSRRELGGGHHLTLWIECHRVEAVARCQPVQASVDAWTELLEQARISLHEFDPTLMTIRSRYTRSVSRRGHPGDLDHVVKLTHDELHARALARVGDDWTGVARAEHAFALLDRGRFGSLDPSIDELDADADLARAHELIELEVGRRAVAHGADHGFTWRARRVLGCLLVTEARRSTGPGARCTAADALAVADGLVDDEWRRAGVHTEQALRGQFLRAEALSLLGRHREAECEARLAFVMARRYRRVDAGRPMLVLARILAHRDRPAALAMALSARDARMRCFSPTAYQIAEAEHLVAQLSA